MAAKRTSKPFSPEEFKEIYSKVPRLTVDLIIKTPKGVVLSLRTHYSWNGYWHFPGGTVLYRESIPEAIERIAQEEIGTSVKVVKLLGYMEARDEEEQRGFGSTISLGFLCTTNETAFTPNEDASRIEVFTELPEPLLPEQDDFLKEHWEEIQHV